MVIVRYLWVPSPLWMRVMRKQSGKGFHLHGRTGHREGGTYAIDSIPLNGQQSHHSGQRSSHLGSHHSSQRASQLQGLPGHQQHGSIGSSNRSSFRPPAYGASARQGGLAPPSSHRTSSRHLGGHGQSLGHPSFLPSSLQGRGSQQMGPHGQPHTSRQGHGLGGPSLLGEGRRSQR